MADSNVHPLGDPAESNHRPHLSAGPFPDPQHTLRVLHVMEALEGGTARHLVDLTTNMSGVESHVAIPHRRRGAFTDVSAEPALRQGGVIVHIVPMSRRPLAPINALAALRLLRLIRRVNPDIVHSHSSIGGALGRIVGRVSKRSTVYTPNGLSQGTFHGRIERGLGRITDRLIAVSDSEATDVLRRGWVDSDRVSVIYNGIDTERLPAPIDVRSLAGIDPAAPLVGTISRLVDQKNPLLWVDMAAAVHLRHPQVRFVIIGDGPLRKIVADRIRILGLDRAVTLLGQLDEAAGTIGQMDCFVLTSRFEGAPYSILEAMRARTPIVATDVVGTHDLLTQSGYGTLVTSEANEIADAVCGVINRSALHTENPHQAMVKFGFTAKSMSENVLSLYESTQVDRASCDQSSSNALIRRKKSR